MCSLERLVLAWLAANKQLNNLNKETNYNNTADRAHARCLKFSDFAAVLHPNPDSVDFCTTSQVGRAYF